MQSDSHNMVINLTAVVVAVTDDQPRILIVDSDADKTSESRYRLPSGPFDPLHHESLESGLRGWVEAQTGLDLYYVEQLYTFGNRNRDPGEVRGGPRVVSVAYIALAREDDIDETGAQWHDWYSFLPWEDWRDGYPAMIGDTIAPALRDWVKSSSSRQERKARKERINVTFGHQPGNELDSVLALERFELLYETGIAAESIRDRGSNEVTAKLGKMLGADHRRILAAALGRLRGKLAYRPVVFELLPGEFTLLQLQRVAEALSGVTLHKQNFRRLVAKADLVEPVGRSMILGRGRPAELFRFRREVLGEKLTVGLSRPTFRKSEPSL
jgi:hypothetical protein